MKLYSVQVLIFEEATPAFPVVVHHFNGRSKREAWHYHESHRKSDSFLRECEDKGKFAKSVKCRAEIYEGWVKL